MHKARWRKASAVAFVLSVVFAILAPIATGYQALASANQQIPRSTNQTAPYSWGDTPPMTIPVGNEAELFSVSCVSSTFCMAVGNAGQNVSYPDPSQLSAGNISEVWNGTSWSAISMETPPNVAFAIMNSVSCVTDTFCMAVGEYNVGTDYNYILANQSEIWNGESWSMLQPPPGNAANYPLTSVWCTSSTFCMASGGYPYGSIWNGSNWSAAALSKSIPTSTATSGIEPISCSAQNFCVASTLAGDGAYFLQSGTTWIQPPSGQPSSLADYIFTGLDCLSQDSCVALGGPPDSFYASLTYDGSTWGSESNLVDSKGAYEMVLQSISCQSATSCVVVGFYLDKAPVGGELGEFQTAVEDYNGSNWSVVSSQNPNEGPSSFDILTDVSCVASGFCMAVGYGSPVNSTYPMPFALTGSAPGAVPQSQGYLMNDSSGGVYSFGSAPFNGSASGIAEPGSIVASAQVPNGSGYWLVSKDGSVYSFGAPFFGSLPSIGVNATNIVAIASSFDGKGYWLVSSNGGVYSFGDAQFYGSAAGSVLNQPIVGIATSNGGDGYWLVDSAGNVYSFGNAPLLGGGKNMQFTRPIIGIVSLPGGAGYWLYSADGGVFAFGDAQFYGSTGAMVLNSPIVSMITTPDGEGYWLIGSDGGVFAFGHAQYLGSMGGKQIGAPIVGGAAS